MHSASSKCGFLGQMLELGAQSVFKKCKNLAFLKVILLSSFYSQAMEFFGFYVISNAEGASVVLF